MTEKLQIETDLALTRALAAERSSSEPRLFLGKWNFYFLVKFFLFWKGLIGFHPLHNLVFAIFILLPVKSDRWRKLKHAVSFLLGVSLLYYDSYLPPINRALSQASVVSTFDASYLLELAGRFISIPVLLTLLLVWVAYRVISRWLKFGFLVISCMMGIAVYQLVSESTTSKNEAMAQQTGTKPNFNNVLNEFYTKEASRSVEFPVQAQDAAPFDVIFIHVCSLSWDDLQAVGLEQHPLWSRFDFLFTHFNSAASYSGPAAIRIQRSTCGQSSNSALYEPAADQCYLLDSLKRGGFEPNLAMNHDGHFDDFLETVQAQRVKVSPMSLEGSAITQRAFDGAPIYDDFSVLNHWFEKRQKSTAARVALYYNSISLHDGNRLVGANVSQDSLETYKVRLITLLDELEKFMLELERSGRHAVVAVIPEHGAALLGDKLQIPGLREIPSPRVTLVPVGIKVIGERRRGETLKIHDETSYLAVTKIVARMLEVSPFTQNGYTPADYADELPTTPFVSQNEGAVVLRYNYHYFWRQNDEDWAEYY